MQFASGSIERIHAMRLAPGEDIMEGLRAACNKAALNNGVILSGIGSLDGAAFLNPVPIAGKKSGYGYGEALRLHGPIELVNMNGMICQGENGEMQFHIHCGLSDQYGNGHGGHLIEGNKVLLTLDVVIGEVGGIIMGRRYDEELEVHVFNPVERRYIKNEKKGLRQGNAAGDIPENGAHTEI